MIKFIKGVGIISFHDSARRAIHHGYRGRQGGWMNLCGDKSSDEIEGEGSGVGSPPPPGGPGLAKVKECVGLRIKVGNNKQRSLGTERSLSKVGTSPPHNLDTPYGLVARKTTTTWIYTKSEDSTNALDLFFT